MLDAVDETIKELLNKKAGWVTRRDAAEALGAAAASSIRALRSCENENDIDVQRGVAAALNKIRSSLSGTAPTEFRAQSLEGMVQALVKSGERDIREEGGGYIVELNLKGGRRQFVHVTPVKDPDGVDIVHVFTMCGPADPKVFELALRANGKIPRGTVALKNHNDEELLVLLHVHRLSDLGPRALKGSVKEVAVYGDWLEQRLNKGEDAF